MFFLLFEKLGGFFPGKQDCRVQSITACCLWPWETFCSWHLMFEGCVVKYGKLCLLDGGSS